MRAVLILAHSWPPDGFVGAVRPVYLARQLARQGWTPIVVTVKERYYECLNQGGIAGSGEALVLRTHCLPNPRHAYLALKALGRKLRLGDGAGQSDSPSTQGPQAIRSPEAGTRTSLKRMLVSLLYTPDEFLGWFPFAFVAAARALRHFDVDCVISTGPPYTSHLIGLTLRRLYGKPWIADFRDPWSWHEGMSSEQTSPLADRLNLLLERRVLYRADRIVCVTPATTDRYRKLYPEIPPERWATITNGFDRLEFASLEPRKPAGRFTISYVGTFDFDRSPEPVLRAVAALVHAGAIPRDRVAIRFVGPCELAQGRSMSTLIEACGLNGVVELTGFLPRPQALAEMASAHVLLLLAGRQRCTVAAKAYEYLGVGRPVLALADEGATADLIRRTAIGRVIPPHDMAGVKRTLYDWYQAWQEGREVTRLVAAPDLTREYEWEDLGGRYAGLVEECIASQGRG